MENEPSPLPSLDELVLAEFPYPIAVGYRRALEAADPKIQVELAFKLFEYGLRTVALGVVVQYLLRDADQLRDPALNRLLVEKLPKATLGSWKDIFFRSLQAYHGRRELLFMRELYDLYWDSSHSPHRKRPHIQHPYNRLVELRNRCVHQFPPDTDREWQLLADEVMKNLRQVLAQFAFVRNYDLVRIIGRHGAEYTYTFYTGEHPVSSSGTVVSSQELQLGWFYLASESNRFLQLHPLIIFWSEPTLAYGPPELAGDAALYEMLTRDSVMYVATVLRKIVRESELVELVHALYSSIEKDTDAKIARQRLTWGVFKEVAGKIADRRFTDTRAKFRKELFLQRQEVQAAFQDFLESDKTAFLLLGKSGVGKSDFLVSLADDYQRQDRLCFLLYNGAKLVSDRPLAETIGNDFERSLHWIDENGEAAIKDFVLELSHIPDIQEHRVVLVIDAVNENHDGRSLLRRIDEFIDSTRYPWFKIMISSRPEAWRVMKRGIRLSVDRFYHAKRPVDLGLEVQAFGVEMSPFTRAELPEVYEKYRLAYNLRTPYSDVPPELRRLLSDPLNLKLIAEIYRNSEIPRSLDYEAIYQHYIEQLIHDERLRIEDIVLLERDLVPLMMKGFENAINGEALIGAMTASGRPLFELIHSDEQLAGGQAVNQSFVNLVGAEILVLRGSAVDYVLAFKYDRFYDYYAGQHIFKSQTGRSDSETAYRKLLQLLPKKPFLWGALRNALSNELERGHNFSLLLDLAHTSDLNLFGLLAEVLLATSEKRSEQIGGLLDSLLNGPDRGSAEATLNAKRLAVEIAGSLGINSILEAALCSPINDLREYATVRVYSYWERDHAGGYEVIFALGKRVLNRLGIPNVGLAETLTHLTGLIVSQHLNEDPTAVKPLLTLWRSLLRRMPLLRGGRSPLALIGVAIRLALYRISNRYLEMVARTSPTEEQASAFLKMFPLSDKERALAVRHASYIDPTFGRLEEIKQELLTNRSRGVLAHQLPQTVLVHHCLSDLDSTLPVIQWLFEHSVDSWGRGSAAGGLAFALLFIPEPPAGAAQICQDYVLRETQMALDENWFRPGDIAGMSIIYLTVEGRRGLQRSQVIPRLLEIVRAKGLDADPGVQKAFITLLRMVALKGYPAFALATLEAMQEGNWIDQKQPEVFQALAEMLSRIGTFYPLELAEYLALDQSNKELANTVKSLSGTGSATELLGLNAWELPHAVSLVPTIRPLWISFLKSVFASRSMGDAIELGVERILEVVQSEQN